MAKITVEAVLKVLEYAALAVYGVVKVCKKETDIKTKKEQLCLQTAILQEEYNRKYRLYSRFLCGTVSHQFLSLQIIFRLSESNGKQKIIHEQEVPEFKREYLLAFPNLVNAKVYVIDDGDHCTMLLAEEY